MSGKLVLVTGASAFIAGHVINQLLDKGYRVRGTVRGERKIKSLTETVKLPGLEFTQIDDVVTSDFTEALKGVYAVIHIASPLPGRTSVDDTINTAIEGVLNVLRQAEKAKIEKIVVTSSFGAVLDPSLRPGFAGLNLTDSDWADVTIEDVRARSDDHFYVYFASKFFAERATWDFAKEHPKVDIATILPGFVYGPFANHFPYPSSTSAFGTNGYVYQVVKGGVPIIVPPWFVDVRDVAKAHICSLELPRMPLEQKRFLINAGNYSWKEAAENIKKTRPQVTVAAQSEFPDFPGPPSTLDTTRAKEMLKFDFFSPQKTMEDFVDSIPLIEAAWR